MAALGACLGVVVSAAPPVMAAGTGSDTVGAGTGIQSATWQIANKRVSFSVNSLTMAGSRCQDAMLDWHHTAGPHYDSRVMRNCKPSTATQSYDWSGNKASAASDLILSDTWWNEPAANWSAASPDDMQRGFGYELSDAYVGGTFAVFEALEFSGAGHAGAGEYWPAIPRTCTDKYARVLTLYNDGHYTGCKNFPSNVAT